jgi:hypothetical protein
MRRSTRFLTAFALAATLPMSTLSASMARGSEQSGGWNDAGAARAPARSSLGKSSVLRPADRSLQTFDSEVPGPTEAVEIDTPPRGHDPRRDCQYITGAYNGLLGLGQRC